MIEFIEIKDIGSLDRERVVFRANEDENIGKYMILCAKYTDVGKNRKLRNLPIKTYWFLDIDVKKDDLIVVYTKKSKGLYREKAVNESSKTHFFYWELNQSLWDGDKTAVVIGTFSDWMTKFVNAELADTEPDEN